MSLQIKSSESNLVEPVDKTQDTELKIQMHNTQLYSFWDDEKLMYAGKFILDNVSIEQESPYNRTITLVLKEVN